MTDKSIMTDKNILIVEDDANIMRFLSLSLKTAGYKVMTASTGIDGISLVLANNPDLVLLDLGLPDIGGLEVLAQIRAAGSLPVIIVSARGQEREKIEALDLGADDYVTKPFNMNELSARIRVALRKAKPADTAQKVFELDKLKVDFEKRRVSLDGAEIHFTPIEYKLLLILIKNAGKVLTHSFIIREIWGYNSGEDSQSLRVFMANIRRKLEADTTSPRYILTEVGVGYRFVDE